MAIPNRQIFAMTSHHRPADSTAFPACHLSNVTISRALRNILLTSNESRHNPLSINFQILYSEKHNQNLQKTVVRPGLLRHSTSPRASARPCTLGTPTSALPILPMWRLLAPPVSAVLANHAPEALVPVALVPWPPRALPSLAIELRPHSHAWAFWPLAAPYFVT